MVLPAPDRIWSAGQRERLQDRTLASPPPGGLLLLYSDGLVERPDRQTRQSLTEIGEVVTNLLTELPAQGADTHTAERVCDRSVQLLTQAGGYTDDVMVLAAHRVPLPAPLDLSLTGYEQAITRASTALGDWLDAVGAGEDDRLALCICAVELVTNSLEHGLAGRPTGTVHLDSRLTEDGSVELVVADDGRWRGTHRRSPSFTGIALRGLGLPLVQSLVQDVHVDRAPSGTTVVVHRRLRRRASLMADQPPARARPPEAPLTIVTEADHPSVVQVSGPLLGDGPERLHNALTLASRGGTEPVLVDLNQVTHLVSRAVRVLQRAGGQPRTKASRWTSSPSRTPPRGRCSPWLGCAPSRRVRDVPTTDPSPGTARRSPR